MKRIIVNKYGGPEVLEIENFKNLKPQELEIKVKVKNVGVNFADSLIIKGRYQERPRPPFSPGLEFSGKILELGNKVTNFKIGDRVIGIAKYGTYTEEIIMPAENIYKIPDQMDYETAASFPVAYGTAHGAIFWKGKLKKNQTCLILGAAGGVEAIELGNQKGPETKNLEVAAVFPFIGLVPRTNLVSAACDESGALLVDEHMMTNQPGLYAAGAVRAGHGGQIAHAIADGKTAAQAIWRSGF